MRLRAASYRWGLEYIAHEPAWTDLCDRLVALGRDDVLATQARLILDWLDPASSRRSGPAGGQQAMNRTIEAALAGTAWAGQQRVLRPTATTPEWTIDFLNDQLGLEVAFNNSGAVPQNLLRLTVRATSTHVPTEKRIRVGIVLLATEALKAWSRMDTTVQTFERLVNVWLPHMHATLPAPLVFVGLEPADLALVQPVAVAPPPPEQAGAIVGHLASGGGWPSSELFPGVKLTYSSTSEAERRQWRILAERQLG